MKGTSTANAQWATQRRYHHVLSSPKSDKKKHGIDKKLLDFTDTLNSAGCTPSLVHEILEKKIKKGDFAVVDMPSRDQIKERKATVKKQRNASHEIDTHEDIRKWAQAYTVADKTVYDQKGKFFIPTQTTSHS